MTDLIKMFDEILGKARETPTNKKSNKKIFTHKHCIAMIKLGWKAIGCKKIDNEESDGVVITWAREDNNLEMPLSFSEQCLWIKYMETNHE